MPALQDPRRKCCEEVCEAKPDTDRSKGPDALKQENQASFGHEEAADRPVFGSLNMEGMS